MQQFSRPPGLITGLEQNRGAAFRRDHRVKGVLQHSHPITHAQAQCATAAALADDHAHDGHPQARHLHQVHGDGLGDAALFAANARIGALSVNQTDHGQAVLLRQFHLGEGFAIAFRVGASEIAGDLLFRIPALVLSDEHDLVAADAREAGHDRPVIPARTIAVQLDVVPGQQAQVVRQNRAMRVPRHLHGFPGRQARVRLTGHVPEGSSQVLDLRRQIARGFDLQRLDLAQLVFDPRQRSFEFEGAVSTRYGGSAHALRPCISHGIPLMILTRDCSRSRHLSRRSAPGFAGRI